MKYKSLLGDLFLSYIVGDDGHNQLTLSVEEFSHQDRLDIVGCLQEHLELRHGFLGFVTLTYFGDGSCSIHAENFWSIDEHPSGHRDKLLLSFE